MFTSTESDDSLSKLLVRSAEALMTADTDTVDRVIAELLADVQQFFAVDTVFVRRNDHENGVTRLVCEWPPRTDVPDPDPIGVVPFSADPIFGATRTLRFPFVEHPPRHDEQSSDYQERIEEGAGIGGVTMAMVPMVTAVDTMGVMGLITFGHREWTGKEIECLSAIATLILQLWRRMAAEDEMRFLALHDDLTGLANRRALDTCLNGDSCGELGALILIDVDDMKVINDGLSYQAGNEYLKGFARLLGECVRPDDRVFRMSGDEFAVAVPAGDPLAASALAHRLLRELSRPIETREAPLARTVSIGVVTDGEDDFLKRANAAKLEAKRSGKNMVVAYDDQVRSTTLDRFQTEVELRAALRAEGQLVVHYQPEYDLLSGRIEAVEALVRWNHPTRGFLPAGAFIGVAEDSGLVVELGALVMRQATAQVARWQKLFGDRAPLLRVNVSPAQLVSQNLLGLIAEAGLAPGSLCVEITEHVVITDSTAALAVLSELRAAGVSVALDDFGTGYSSMSQLKVLPIDFLKIDMSFIDGLGVDPKATAIVESIVRLADAFGLSTVAEGVERPEQVDELRTRGCHRAQGYLLAKPMSPEAVEELLLEDAPTLFVT